MSENKEETLASFQNITGIDDVGEAFSHLEAVNWNLMDALSRVMPHEDPSLASAIHQSQPALAENTNGFRPPGYDELPGTSSGGFFAPERQNLNIPQRFPTSQLLAQLTSSINLDPVASQNNNQNNQDLILFNIHFNQQICQIRLPPQATIEQLKRCIFEKTRVPVCRQAIQGWPPSKASEAQQPSSRLGNLDLAQENDLSLVDLTDDGYMDTEQDEVTQRADKTFSIHIQFESESPLELSLPGNTTMLQVKMHVDDIKSIPVRHQEWTGWPRGCDNDTTLARSGIDLTHSFGVRNLAPAIAAHSNSNQQQNNSYDVVNVDSESSADEFEDATDFNFTDSPPAQPLNIHLIPNNTDDEMSGSAQFVDNYVARYGEPCPYFFVGSLESALQMACYKPAKERKLLAIYLHHGKSILTNVFCDQLMKNETIIQTFMEKFVLYGWDLTFESNKDMFLSSLTACISSNASLMARNIGLDKLPAIMLVGKSRELGSGCGVLSVIPGNIDLDDLLTRLIGTCERFEEQLQGEIRQDDERAARDQVKAEQDMAYEATLQADRAKDAAKRQREAAQAAERKRLESERAEEDARRESIRLIAQQSLPQEPAEQTTGTAKIRVRKPSGEFLERRFLKSNSLQDLLNFVTANGFLIEEYKLLSWPRRDLTAMESGQTLEALKLYPQETVFLEER
ncbi:hypothetical protein KR074_007524 [Drosophila pseudoananassae]|nr:hypothetical protein KR074_007524 [Drosophila pseudoananassae]